MQAAHYKLEFGHKTIPVSFVRNGKARRYILRMAADGIARVTIPRGGSLAQASSFVQKNKAWIEKQLARMAPEWIDGTLILLRGIATPLRIEQGLVSLGAYHFGAVARDLRHHVQSCLRSVAEPELVEATRCWAQRLGLIYRVTRVRDQRTRWGSCSSKGVINLNWRLIQTPEFVRDYIIVHELMHLREMNHSARFWDHVAAAFPRYEEAERWLRKNAALLR